MKFNWMPVVVLGAFLLSACGANENVITTESGLQYVEVLVGEGDEAVADMVVSVHYTGWLQNADSANGLGAKFDSSVDRGEPLNFPIGVGSVIPGWDEGISGMKVGGKRKLTIPPDLAYGERDLGVIPPNSTLVFDVELMDVNDPTIGFEIEDVVVGEGAEAVSGSTVEVHYTGWLQDLEAESGRGEVFDSSVDGGQTVEFPIGVGRVILGWERGIPGMKVGGKRVLTVPPLMGYGSSANGAIPPNSTLIFEVELFNVVGADNGTGEE